MTGRNSFELFTDANGREAERALRDKGYAGSGVYTRDNLVVVTEDVAERGLPTPELNFEARTVIIYDPDFSVSAQRSRPELRQLLPEMKKTAEFLKTAGRNTAGFRATDVGTGRDLKAEYSPVE